MIIGTGIDIIEIARLKQAIDRWGDHFLKHVFHEEEIEYARKHQNPLQHYAARFAAKEAVYKAINHRTHFGWKDLKIVNDENGRPFCVFLNKPFKHKIFLSLSHSKNYAIASAIVTQ